MNTSVNEIEELKLRQYLKSFTYIKKSTVVGLT